MLSKEQKIKIIDYLELLCNKSCFSNKTLGIFLRGIHAFTPINFLVGLFFCSFNVATFCCISLIGVILLYILFNGCFLTMLETRLCKDNYTIADPFLEIFKMENTKENRKKISIIIINFYTILFFFIYYIKFFILKKNQESKYINVINN